MINLQLKKQLVYFLLILFSPILWAEDLAKLLPVDEAERDLSLLEFRTKMLQAIERKEPEVFVTMLDQKIWASRKKRGMKNFIEMWQPDSIDSELWSELGTVLRMGGSFVRSERGVRFCSPYVYTTFPDSLDPFGHGAIIKERAVMKSDASSSSRTITSLSYDLVKVHDWRSKTDPMGERFGNWIKVSSLLSGNEGYVDKANVRSPTDYTACFLFTTKRGWKLESFMNNE